MKLCKCSFLAILFTPQIRADAGLLEPQPLQETQLQDDNRQGGETRPGVLWLFRLVGNVRCGCSLYFCAADLQTLDYVEMSSVAENTHLNDNPYLSPNDGPEGPSIA